MPGVCKGPFSGKGGRPPANIGELIRACAWTLPTGACQQSTFNVPRPSPRNSSLAKKSAHGYRR